MKRLIAMAIIAVTAIEFVSAAPEVTDITAKQRYPWNGLVDITCKVSGIEADAGGYEFAVVAVDKETGKEYTVSNFSIQHNGEDVPDVCGNGDYSLLWNARADLGQVVVERMTVKVVLVAPGLAAGKVQLWEGGPYWADRNIGASKPEEYGLYFWCGDTTGHRPSGETFSFSFIPSNCPTIFKDIDTLLSEGWIVSKGGTYVLASRHDAGNVKWGGGWRMPTEQEFSDLLKKCTWTWMTTNGVNGYVVCGIGDYASNSIFLPASGYGDKTSINNVGTRGVYWSSQPWGSAAACGLRFTRGGRDSRKLFSFYEGYRYYGQSIRPVQ